MQRSRLPLFSPDGSIVFMCHDDLTAWALEYARTQGYSELSESSPTSGEEVAVYEPRQSTAPRKIPPPLNLSRKGPSWTSTLVLGFMTSPKVSTRSKDLARNAALLGRNGMTAKKFGETIDSNPNGLGKRFAKLERDSGSFSHGLPLPAYLEGGQGRRTLIVDPTFAAAYREASGDLERDS